MAAPASAQPLTLQPPQSASSGNSGRGRSRRRGHGPRGGVTPSQPRNSTASLDSNSHEAHGSNVNSSNSQPRQSGGNGGRVRGRGRGRGGSGRATETRTVGGRAFGGGLTREDPVPANGASSSTPHLQGHAPVFVPGQQHVQLPVQASLQSDVSKPLRPSKRRASKSQAPDIATRTHEDIDNGHYECPICTSEVQRNSKVWSCHTCWTVFHLTCIKKWSSNAGSSVSRNEPQGVDLPPPRQWRCPGCNLPQDDMPKSYTCWCEKETDPKSLAGLPPHSCGQTCARERVRKCPHPCQLTCHAGPCPPCSHMGPTQSCYCAKHETTKRCMETNYESGWSCGDVCSQLMPCGIHTCSRPCHDGPCGACEVRIPARCYCGQMEKDVLCGERGVSMNSSVHHSVENDSELQESWTGIFDCESTCGRFFDCGKHQCQKSCHAQDAHAGHCPRSPDVVTVCPCGKTTLNELSARPRTDCKDPIPNCERPCDKTMACGHFCLGICHTGECPPCLQYTHISCRCGRVTSSTICHQGSKEPPQCMRLCRANMNCGRHACEERCCTGEKKALERQSSKRKQRPLGSAAPRSVDDMFEPEHICTRQCGRLLKCGTHYCEELCHKGPCGSCREAIFDEIACHCGRTVLQPPLPCGTRPPVCRYSCERPKTCGHPQVAHNCHQDHESCPRCPFLVEKRCMCMKKVLKNQQCWLQDVRCGEVCGARLRCGVHLCRKPCHRPGECEDAGGQACQQTCGKEKRLCGHPDEALCHAPFACKEDKPCASKIFITCVCQAQKQEVKCAASKAGEGNAGKTLPCTDECARLERNRKLALALNIDSSQHVEGGDHVPYSTETLNLFAAHAKWAQTFEREFRVFATSEDEKRLRFKPMQAQQRAFLHALADDFGLDSESVDPEPHRHVMVWKTPRFVSAPNKTLADSLRIRQQSQAMTVPVASAQDAHENPPQLSKTTVNHPYNSFLIPNPRFGLTIDEVRTQVAAALTPSAPALTFDIEFLPSEAVVLKAMSRTLASSPQDLQDTLQTLKAPIAAAIASKNYGFLELCATDSSLNILSRESEVNNSAARDGWSRVAAKKAALKTNLRSTGIGSLATNAFSPLSGDALTHGGGKVAFVAKKKPKIPAPLPVVDDWEAAESAEEEKERADVGEDVGEGRIELIRDVSTGQPEPAQIPAHDISDFNVSETSASVAAHLADANGSDGEHESMSTGDELPLRAGDPGLPSATTDADSTADEGAHSSEATA